MVLFVANLVRLLFTIYIILIFVRVLFTWLRPHMFNPIVRFVYMSTDPYLKLFAGLKFLRVGNFDFSILLAFFSLLLMQRLSFEVILTGHFSFGMLLSAVNDLLYQFIRFFLFIFIIAVALRLIFGLIRRRISNAIVTIAYSLSEPVVRPIRNLLNLNRDLVVDIPSIISFVILILFRFLILPKLHELISALISI